MAWGSVMDMPRSLPRPAPRFVGGSPYPHPGSARRRRVDNRDVSIPLPGSSDEHRARARVARAVDRGEQLPSGWEAQMAADLAAQKLAQLPKQKRAVWAAGGLKLALGLVLLAAGEPVLGALF